MQTKGWPPLPAPGFVAHPRRQGSAEDEMPNEYDQPQSGSQGARGQMELKSSILDVRTARGSAGKKSIYDLLGSLTTVCKEGTGSLASWVSLSWRNSAYTLIALLVSNATMRLFDSQEVVCSGALTFQIDVGIGHDAESPFAFFLLTGCYPSITSYQALIHTGESKSSSTNKLRGASGKLVGSQTGYLPNCDAPTSQTRREAVDLCFHAYVEARGLERYGRRRS